jgi:hypothetical protein
MTTIGIIIWDNAEPLDFVAPYEVFNHTSKFLRGTEDLKIFIIGATEGEINAQGLVIPPHYSLENSPTRDMVLFLGGESVTLWRMER